MPRESEPKSDCDAYVARPIGFTHFSDVTESAVRQTAIGIWILAFSFKKKRKPIGREGDGGSRARHSRRRRRAVEGHSEYQHANRATGSRRGRAHVRPGRAHQQRCGIPRGSPIVNKDPPRERPARRFLEDGCARSPDRGVDRGPSASPTARARRGSRVLRPNPASSPERTRATVERPALTSHLAASFRPSQQ